MQNTQGLTLNPFAHIANGLKKLWKTNFWTIAVTYIVQLVITFVIGLIMAGVLKNAGVASLTQNSLRTPEEVFSDLGKFFVIMIPFLLVLGVISLIFSLIINRLLLTGVRKQKVPIGVAIKAALGRFWLAILLGLMLLGIAIGVGVVFGLLAAVLSAAAPALGALLAVVFVISLIVALILYLPTLTLINLALIDDEKPAGPVAVLKKCQTVAKQVTGKIWLLVLVAFVAAIIASALTGDLKTTTTTSTSNTYTGSSSFHTTSSNSSTSPAKTFVGNLLGVVVSALFSVGLAEVYVKVTGGEAHTAPKPAASTAAAAPPTPPATPQA